MLGKGHVLLMSWWHEILHQLNTRMVNDGSWYDTCYICYMIFRLLHLSHHISTGKQDLFQGFFPSNPGGLDSFRSVEATKNWWPKVAPTATFLLLRVRWAEVGVTKLTTATRTTTTTTTRGYKRRKLEEWSTAPKKDMVKFSGKSVSSNNDIVFFFRNLWRLTFHPGRSRDAIDKRWVTNAVRSYDVLILEGAAPEILITVFLYSVLLTLTYLKVLILFRAKNVIPFCWWVQLTSAFQGAVWRKLA